MNDIATDPSVNGSAALLQTLAELERRVLLLETKVAALPDAQKIEEHVTERIKANMPPPVDPVQSPGFRDIEIPMPSVQTVIDTAKTGWLLFEMLRELKTAFWSLVDRRYHKAWITRGIVILLLIYILTSHWWSADNFLSRTWDKMIDVALCLIVFLVMTFETRRYKEWRGGPR